MALNAPIIDNRLELLLWSNLSYIWQCALYCVLQAFFEPCTRRYVLAQLQETWSPNRNDHLRQIWMQFFFCFCITFFLLFVVCCMCIDGAIIDMSICTQASVFNRQIKYTGQLMYFTLTRVWCVAKHYSCTLFGFSNCRIIKVWYNMTRFVNIRFPRNRIHFIFLLFFRST